MRSSSILLSLALLLCIGSISAESLLTGTWSNPYTSKNVSRYCCIPTSIEVQSSGSGFTAYYKYPSSLNSNCWNLFLSSSSGDMKLYSTGSSYNTESAYSETTFFGGMVFDFYASNTTGTPNLHVYSDSSAYSDQCDFTMYTRVAPPGGSWIGGLIAFIVIILIVGCCCGANKYQKSRGNVIIVPNMAQQPTVVTTYGAPGGYVAPSNVVVTQGYVQQPQMTYNAPNQFPNTQVNMNYNSGYNN